MLSRSTEVGSQVRILDLEDGHRVLLGRYSGAECELEVDDVLLFGVDVDLEVCAGEDAARGAGPPERAVDVDVRRE